MKQIIFRLCAFASMMSISLFPMAQKSKSDSKTEEVVIVKKGKKDAKITLEMNGDNIIVNGKPLDEYIADGIIIKSYDLEKAMNIEGETLHNLGANLNKSFAGWNDSTFKEKRAFLGITTEKADIGVKIIKIEEGSAADKAGLKKEDIITSINNTAITDPDNLIKVIHGFKPKEKISIAYERNGKKKDTQATLGETANVFRNFSFMNKNNRDYIPDPKLFSELFKQNRNEAFSFVVNDNHKLGLKIEDLDESEGVKVTGIETNSVAEKAGIQKGDILTQVNGNKVVDVNDIRQKLRETRNKTNYTLKGTRNGTDMMFNIIFPKKKNKADL